MTRRLARTLLAIGVLGIWVALATRNAIPDLAAIGRRIPGFTSSSTLFLGPYWSSTRNLLVIQASNAGAGSIFLDVETGHTAKGASFGQGLWLHDGAFLSPDLRRVLRRSARTWSLTDLDGRVVGEWPIGRGEAFWAPDSRSWVVIHSESDRIFRFEVNRQKPTVCRLPNPVGRPLYYAGNDKMVFYNVRAKPELVSVLLSSPSQQHRLPVTLPHGAKTVFDLRASPKGDRLGWYLGRQVNGPSWMEWLLSRIGANSAGSKHRRGLPDPGVDTEGIWISRMDGSAMTPIGEVKAEWAPEGMASFTWRPDGKRILITYRHGIYDVPVD